MRVVAGLGERSGPRMLSRYGAPPPPARVGSEPGGQQRLLRAVMSKLKGKQELDRWSIIPTDGMAST